MQHSNIMFVILINILIGYDKIIRVSQYKQKYIAKLLINMRLIEVNRALFLLFERYGKTVRFVLKTRHFPYLESFLPGNIGSFAILKFILIHLHRKTRKTP